MKVELKTYQFDYKDDSIKKKTFLAVLDYLDSYAEIE